MSSQSQVRYQAPLSLSDVITNCITVIIELKSHGELIAFLHGIMDMFRELLDLHEFSESGKRSGATFTFRCQYYNCITVCIMLKSCKEHISLLHRIMDMFRELLDLHEFSESSKRSYATFNFRCHY